MEILGKTAIVTGGAVRLGRSLALALAERGVNIVLHYYHSDEEAQTTAAEIQAHGVKVELVRADFSKAESSAKTVIEAAASAFGSAEILINSAAIFEPATLEETTGDIWNRHLAINLESPFFLSREFAACSEKTRPNGGNAHILNILDWRATHPQAGTGHLAYTIAKSGLAALTKALAVELGPKKIQVNGIAPGAILPPPGEDDQYLEQLAQNNPLRRVGSAEEIVRAALYFLQAEFVTGEILHLSGGEHLSA